MIKTSVSLLLLVAVGFAAAGVVKDVCPVKGNFQCDDGICIPQRWVCNGEDDCLDATDEVDCGDFDRKEVSTCYEDEFKCVSSGVCVPNNLVCDGDYDCIDESHEADESDEADCAKPDSEKHVCREDQFKCAGSRHCIPKPWVCDGDVDCDDSSDEANCPSTPSEETKGETTCNEEQFRCGSTGHCIPKDWICDGDEDCRDSSDEENCVPE